MNKLITKYPFLYEEKEEDRFGLTSRAYFTISSLVGHCPQSKEEILKILEGKNKADLFKVRNFGKKSFESLKTWVKKNCEIAK